MQISNDKAVHELIAEFNQVFPFLKIEFYSVSYLPSKLFSNDKLIRHSASIAQCRKSNQEGDLVLSPQQTVAQLEQELWTGFGLSAQVFRKSGSLWIETSLTDSWTLKQQNLEGEQMTSPVYEYCANMDVTDRDQVE